MLGAFYSLVGLTYIFFEVVVVNFRPILIDGVLEASYPSSHTMLALCICISGIIVNNKLFNKNLVLKIVNIALFVLAIVVVITRYLSGAHWITDILGALIISALLLSMAFLILSLSRLGIMLVNRLPILKIIKSAFLISFNNFLLIFGSSL